MSRVDDSLNESVAQIIVALINNNKISVNDPSTAVQEEITSAIKRIKNALTNN